MRDLNTVNSEIDELKKSLLEVKGTPTEVYTRIVGYYRSVKNWNRGKKEEYGLRKLFNVPDQSQPSPRKESSIHSETRTEEGLLVGAAR